MDLIDAGLAEPGEIGAVSAGLPYTANFGLAVAAVVELIREEVQGDRGGLFSGDGHSFDISASCASLCAAFLSGMVVSPLFESISF